MFWWNKKNEQPTEEIEAAKTFAIEMDKCAEILGLKPLDMPPDGIVFKGNKGWYSLTGIILAWNKKIIETMEKLNE